VLVGVANAAEDRAGAGAAANDVLDIQVVVGVGGLKPGAAVVQVEVDRVGRSKHIVDTIEDVLLVALVMKDLELRRIEEAAGIHTVGFNEVSPLLAAECEVHSADADPNAPYEVLMLPVGLVTPWPERVLATMTRLVLPPYSAGGAPLMTSMDWMELAGSGWRKPCSADR